MPRPIRWFAAAGLLCLSGCASLSESQCLASDWETIGFRDGLSGTHSTALMRHQDACVPHGVIPDRQAYLAGWRDGVAQYCQPANGFAAGERGAGYGNVCPAHLQHAFHAAYQSGRQIYLAQAEIDRLNQTIAQREARLTDVKTELANIATGLLDPVTTTGERAAMLLSARDLAQEQGSLEAEIEELQAEAAVRTDRLERLRHSLALAH